MSDLTRQSWIAATERAVAREIDGETVILDLEKAEYFGLNRTGTRIWHMIQQPASVDDICSRLASDFDMPEERVETDVLELITDLVKNGLAAVVAAPR